MSKRMGGGKKGAKAQARAAEDAMEHIGNVPIPTPNRITPDFIKRTYNGILSAKKDVEKAQDALKTLMGVYRAKLKDAKSAGLSQHDLDAVTTVLKWRKQEIEDVNGYVQAVNRLCAAIDFPIEPGSQLGLFDETRSVATAGEDQKLDATAERAKSYQKGYAAGKAGKLATSNPFPAASENSHQFDQGWKDAQAEIAGEMAPGASAKVH